MMKTECADIKSLQRDLRHSDQITGRQTLIADFEAFDCRQTLITVNQISIDFDRAE